MKYQVNNYQKKNYNKIKMIMNFNSLTYQKPIHVKKIVK